MHTRFLVGAALLAGLAVASCDRPSAPAGKSAPAAFSHAATADISGYYVPADPVRISEWRLGHVFIGSASEFETWEGGARGGTFGPVMLQFDDASRPMAAPEPGESRSITVRVLPTRYQVTDTSVSFVGRSPELGRVAFDGRLDPEALATARRNLGDDGVVLSGTLTAGSQTVRDVRLRWWMGD